MNCALADRVCLCCKASKPCAHRLTLSKRDEWQLRRIEWLIAGGPWQVPSFKRASQSQAVEPTEPTTSTPCRKCGVAFQMLAFLVEFLKLRGLTPECEGCR